MNEVAQVVDRLARELCPAPVAPDADPLGTVSWDSLALEQLIAEVEQALLVLLDPEDVSRANFADVPTLAHVVARRVALWDAEAPRH